MDWPDGELFPSKGRITTFTLLILLVGIHFQPKKLLLWIKLSLFQVLISATVLAFASSAPVDPLTAAVGATVNALGNAAGTAAIGTAGVGSGIILKHLVTGDGSIPRVSAGINTGLGLGPLRLGGKVGAGFGGVAPGTWYEPLSEEETLLLQAQLGLGLGQTDLYTGAGLGLNYGWPKEDAAKEEEGKVISSEVIEVGEWAPVGEPVAISEAKPFLEFATGGTLGPLEANVDVGI